MNKIHIRDALVRARIEPISTYQASSPEAIARHQESAYRDALRWARESGYEFVETDDRALVDLRPER